MKKDWVARFRVKVFSVLAVLSLVVIPLIPMPVLAADSLDSRACTANAPNLVQNPGFEPDQLTYSPIKYIDEQGVPGWVSSAGRSLYRPTTHGGGTAQIAEGSYFSTTSPFPNTYEGARAAALPGFHPPTTYGGMRPVIYGTLSATPVNNVTPGVKYRLSARVYKDDQAGSPPAAIEMRLYNSSDQTQSAPVRASVSDASSWVLVTGVVTATKSYDKVLMRFWKDGDWVLVDDVVVCKAAPTHQISWQQILALGAGGLALLVLLGGLLLETLWRPRSSKGTTGSKAKGTRVTAADVNGDGRADKIAENESPRPLVRSFLTNKIVLVVAGLVLVAASVYVGTASGGVWRTIWTTTDRCDGTLTCMGAKSDNQAPTNTPAAAKTCKDNEAVAEGYKLFYSDTHKYCVQYPTDWPVDSKNPDMVVFGTKHPEPVWGSFTVTYFPGKTVATRTEELMASYREPAGSCVRSDATIGSQAYKKLVCEGAFGGDFHVYYLGTPNNKLVEFSYIDGTGEDKTKTDAIYKTMLDSVGGDNSDIGAFE